MTLVSFRHNFVYLRTRKTGSSTISMVLQPLCMPEGEPVEEFRAVPLETEVGIVSRSLGKQPETEEQLQQLAEREKAGKPMWIAHQSAKSVRDALDPEFWENAIKVTSVRNPFTRMVSSFYWNAKVRDKDVSSLSPDEQIEEFRGMIRRNKFVNDRTIVKIQKTFIPEVLIRQESLKDDLASFAERLGVNLPLDDMPHAKKVASSNKTRPSYSEFYDDETADIVRMRFAWAFKNCGYSKEVPSG